MANKTCPDCGASPGENHQPGCDVERCPLCGGQMISCGCEESSKDALAEEQLLPWTGEWPGTAECAEYGFYSRWGPPWIRCEKDHPDAGPDLNRLVTECRWNREKRKWVPK